MMLNNEDDKNPDLTGVLMLIFGFEAVVTKEQFEEIDEMYNNGEISLSEASLRRDNLERRRKEELLEIKSCPNCGEKISYGVFSKNEL